MKKKRILAVNPPIDQFIEQDFPVEKDSSALHLNKVQVTEYYDSHRSVYCSFFYVEVVKDCYGFISYILNGKAYDDIYRDVQIMRTDDFNRAFDLKNRLEELVNGRKLCKEKLMPCFGSLQREALPWEIPLPWEDSKND